MPRRKIFSIFEEGSLRNLMVQSFKKAALPCSDFSVFSKILFEVS